MTSFEFAPRRAAMRGLGRSWRNMVSILRACRRCPRPWQFSLRSLLVAVGIAALAFAWYNHQLEQVADEERTVAQFARFRVRSHSRFIGPRWLDRLGLRPKGFFRITTLDLDCEGNRLGATEFSEIAKLRHLSYLSLSGPDVTDATLHEVSQLRGLTGLDLTETSITDAGLDVLCDLRRLRQLRIVFTQITDEGLAKLRCLPQLEWLDLINTRVSDKSIELFKTWKTLRQLDLRYTDVTIEGAESIRKARPGLGVGHHHS